MILLKMEGLRGAQQFYLIYLLDISILSINASKKRCKYEIAFNVDVKTFSSQKIENAVTRRIKTFKSLAHEIMWGGVRRNYCRRYL